MSVMVAQAVPKIWGLDYPLFILLCLLFVAGLVDEIEARRKRKRGVVLAIIFGKR